MKPALGAAVVLGVLAVSLLLSFLPAYTALPWLRLPGAVKVYIYKYTNISGLTSLYVNDTDGAIRVGEWSGSYVYVNATLTRFLYPLSVNASVQRVGGTLDILVHQPSTLTTFIGYFTLSFNILIPESLHSLGVHVSDVNGDININLENFTSVQVISVNGDIQLTLGSGDSVAASDVNGNIVLTSSTIGALDLTTVNGEISAGFTPTSGGTYRALTANGDIRVMIPSSSSLTVTMATVNGAINVSGLQLDNVSSTKTTLTGTLGSGSAALTLTTTNGDIQLTSP